MAAPQQRGLKGFLPIYSERLLIRVFRIEDAEALFQLHRDAAVTQYAGGTKTQTESYASLERLIQKVEATGFGALAVEDRATGALLGWCGIERMNDFDEFEVTYGLAVSAWGKGLALEAATELVSRAFAADGLDLDRIFGLVYRENTRSIRVLEKLGMRFVMDHLDRATQRFACLYRLDRNNVPLNHSSSK